MSNAEAVARYAARHPERKRTSSRRCKARRLKQFPEVDVWRGMLARCYNPNHIGYHNYGGRGIGVCAKWRGSFDAFFADVGHRPSSRHQLERPKNDQNYGPKNWKWATPRQQSRNMRTNRVIKIGRRAQPLCDWAQESGVNYGTIRTRLRDGWPTRQAIFQPARAKAA